MIESTIQAPADGRCRFRRSAPILPVSTAKADSAPNCYRPCKIPADHDPIRRFEYSSDRIDIHWQRRVCSSQSLLLESRIADVTFRCCKPCVRQALLQTAEKAQS